MDLQARPLQYFIAVARERSFSRAAQQLNVSQPSLSAQVRELERLLGFALFERSSRQVQLTREGRLFLADARRMVVEASRLNRAAREIRRSELRIGAAIYSVLIPERVRLVDAFNAAHPDIAMHVENVDQVQQYRRLRRGDLDISLAIGLGGTDMADSEADPLSEIVLPSDFERLSLATRPVRLLVPSESTLALRDPIALAALRGVRIAMVGDYHGAELIDAITLPLTEAGADLVVPPEGNAISVERFGARARQPAITLGWFDYGPASGAMVVRAVEGLDVTTDLAVLRLHAAEHRPAVDAFWAFAGGWVAR